MQLWTPFLLQNMAANLEALQAGQPLPYIITNSFWDFYVVHGASGGVIALAILLVRSKFIHFKFLLILNDDVNDIRIVLLDNCNPLLLLTARPR